MNEVLAWGAGPAQETRGGGASTVPPALAGTGSVAQLDARLKAVVGGGLRALGAGCVQP